VQFQTFNRNTGQLAKKKMKFLIVFALVIVAALAAPPKSSARQSRASSSDAEATILKYENDNIGIDGYNFA
jgi:hypothetical protein